MVSQKMKSSTKTFDHNRSSLGLHGKTFEHSSSSLGHQCLMMSDHNSSDLAPQRQMASAKNNTSDPVPQRLKTFDRLVLHKMTSDHNRSELGIQDHGNEQSSSKLVP
ncbi:hypothetical protein Tco_0125277, partial [Tanacetum coccineum]